MLVIELPSAERETGPVLRSFRLADMHNAWSLNIPGCRSDRIACRGDVGVIAIPDGDTIGVDLRRGRLLWDVAGHDRTLGAVAFAAVADTQPACVDVAAVAERTGSNTLGFVACALRARNLATGKARWQRETYPHVTALRILAGQAVVYAKNGFLMTYSLDTGEPRDTLRAGIGDLVLQQPGNGLLVDVRSDPAESVRRARCFTVRADGRIVPRWETRDLIRVQPLDAERFLASEKTSNTWAVRSWATGGILHTLGAAGKPLVTATLVVDPDGRVAECVNKAFTRNRRDYILQWLTVSLDSGRLLGDRQHRFAADTDGRNLVCYLAVDTARPFFPLLVPRPAPANWSIELIDKHSGKRLQNLDVPRNLIRADNRFHTYASCLMRGGAAVFHTQEGIIVFGSAPPDRNAAAADAL
jgi:hypothetical protein